jgi:hypothetical protein
MSQSIVIIDTIINYRLTSRNLNILEILEKSSIALGTQKYNI